MRETWVRSLGREDPLEKERATHSSILASRIPWTEEPGGLQSTGWQRVGYDWVTTSKIAPAVRVCRVSGLQSVRMAQYHPRTTGGEAPHGGRQCGHIQGSCVQTDGPGEERALLIRDSVSLRTLQLPRYFRVPCGKVVKQHIDIKQKKCERLRKTASGCSAWRLLVLWRCRIGAPMVAGLSRATSQTPSC